MKGGYRDGLKHQKGRNKGSLHSKVAQSYMTPSLYLCFIFYKQSWISNKDIGMVSCSFVQLCCVTTPCFFLFGASNHPYIPFHFEEMIFPLVSTIFYSLWQHYIDIVSTKTISLHFRMLLNIAALKSINTAGIEFWSICCYLTWHPCIHPLTTFSRYRHLCSIVN